MLFSKKQCIGIDIADHSIEAVLLSSSGPRGMKISAMGRSVIPEGIVERGRIRDAARLRDAVTRVLEEANPNPITEKRAIFGLPDSQVYVHAFETSEDISGGREAVIEKEIRAVTPLESSRILFSYAVSRETKESSRVVSVAADTGVIKEWKVFFGELGLDVQMFEAEPIAIFRSLYADPPQAPVAIVDIGSATTSVSFFDSYGLLYSRIVPIAGDSFTKEISKSLSVPFREAEQRKKKSGLSEDDAPVFAALVKSLETLADEIKSAIGYFEEKNGRQVSEIMVVGGSSRLAGIFDFFRANLGERISGAGNDDSLYYIEAIGLALRGLSSRWDGRDPAFDIKNAGEEYPAGVWEKIKTGFWGA